MTGLRNVVGPALLGVALNGSPTPVQAGPGPIAEILCAPAAQMRDKLRRQFRSERAWQGLRAPDQIMELWEDDQGEWTLVVAHANGNTCIVAMGSRLTGFPDALQG